MGAPGGLVVSCVKMMVLNVLGRVWCTVLLARHVMGKMIRKKWMLERCLVSDTLGKHPDPYENEF